MEAIQEGIVSDRWPTVIKTITFFGYVFFFGGGGVENPAILGLLGMFR